MALGLPDNTFQLILSRFFSSICMALELPDNMFQLILSILFSNKCIKLQALPVAHLFYYPVIFKFTAILLHLITALSKHSSPFVEFISLLAYHLG